jgi:hypothetical protein
MRWNLKCTSQWAVRAVSSLAVAIPTTRSLCKDDKKETHDVAVYLSDDSRAALKLHLGNDNILEDMLFLLNEYKIDIISIIIFTINF